MERELDSLLLSCKLGLHFLFLLINANVIFSVLQTVFLWKGYICCADTPPCALLPCEVCVSTNPGSVHTHKLSYSRMSLWNVCEIHRGIFNDWIHHTLPFWAGLFLIVEQFVRVNFCAAIPTGRHSTDLSILSLHLCILVLHICCGMPQRNVSSDLINSFQ